MCVIVLQCCMYFANIKFSYLYVVLFFSAIYISAFSCQYFAFPKTLFFSTRPFQQYIFNMIRQSNSISICCSLQYFLRDIYNTANLRPGLSVALDRSARCSLYRSHLCLSAYKRQISATFNRRYSRCF